MTTINDKYATKDDCINNHSSIKTWNMWFLGIMISIFIGTVGFLYAQSQIVRTESLDNYKSNRDKITNLEVKTTAIEIKLDQVMERQDRNYALQKQIWEKLTGIK